MDTTTKSIPRATPEQIGGRCVNGPRRHPNPTDPMPCRGRITAKRCPYRNSDGTLEERIILVCNRCGQAHGPAMAERPEEQMR